MSIKLTSQQQELVQWALDEMEPYWCTQAGADERGGLVYESRDMPRIEDGWLILSDAGEINGDLLYRISEQAPNAARTESHEASSAENRVSANLTQKLVAAGVDLQD